jgi:molybdenum cofactor biosynthesis enzyme MoaA
VRETFVDENGISASFCSLDQPYKKVQGTPKVTQVFQRMDNAKEFLALKPWAEEKGIELEFTELHTPAQNGPA